MVDDDEDVRHILGAVLEKRGLIVHGASSGRQALGLLAEHPYAVVLLDLVMPDIDGFDVLHSVQSQWPQSPPVVLVLTGAEQEIVDRLDPHRIHGIIRKPFDPEEIASLVVACSEIKRRSTFRPMAIATMISSAQFIAWLNRFGG